MRSRRTGGREGVGTEWNGRWVTESLLEALPLSRSVLSESDFAGGRRVGANRRVVDGEFERDGGARHAESGFYLQIASRRFSVRSSW